MNGDICSCVSSHTWHLQAASCPGLHGVLRPSPPWLLSCSRPHFFCNFFFKGICRAHLPGQASQGRQLRKRLAVSSHFAP